MTVMISFNGRGDSKMCHSVFPKKLNRRKKLDESINSDVYGIIGGI